MVKSFLHLCGAESTLLDCSPLSSSRPLSPTLVHSISHQYWHLQCAWPTWTGPRDTEADKPPGSCPVVLTFWCYCLRSRMRPIQAIPLKNHKDLLFLNPRAPITPSPASLQVFPSFSGVPPYHASPLLRPWGPCCLLWFFPCRPPPFLHIYPTPSLVPTGTAQLSPQLTESPTFSPQGPNRRRRMTIWENHGLRWDSDSKESIEIHNFFFQVEAI